MAYRALLTVRDTITGESQDYCVLLGDGFEEAEQAAEILARQTSYKDGLAALPFEVSPREFSSRDARNQWIATYADQLWDVHFRTIDGYTRVEANGWDSMEAHIFKRVRVNAIL